MKTKLSLLLAVLTLTSIIGSATAADPSGTITYGPKGHILSVSGAAVAPLFVGKSNVAGDNTVKVIYGSKGNVISVYSPDAKPLFGSSSASCMSKPCCVKK